MNSGKDHIVYSAEDIQKYLSGKLASAEMHAMEKAALDDAFLAEAMEGYGGMSQKDWEQPLALLRNHFSKLETARVIPLKTATRFAAWKVAAAVFICCGGLAVAIKFTSKYTAQTNTIATINQAKDSIHTIVPAPVINDSIAQSNDGNTETALNKSKPAKLPTSALSQKQIMADSAFTYRASQAEKIITRQGAGGGYTDDTLKARTDIVNNNSEPSASQNNLDQFKNNNITSSKSKDVDGLKKAAPVLTMHKFTARVVGPDGASLPFANISITKENVGTYADARGNFSLISDDSVLNIEIKSAGFVNRNVTLMSNIIQSRIALIEDEFALKEKTSVPGNMSPAIVGRKRARLIPDTVINVEPEDGWRNYDTYIINNLSLSKDIRQKKIHGEVEVSFDVQTDGTLANVKIDKSLCDDCDEAALRAIKEGPRWKIKNGGQSTGKIKVKF